MKKIPMARHAWELFPLTVVLISVSMMPSTGQQSSSQVDIKQTIQKMQEQKRKKKEERETAVQKLKQKIEPLMQLSIQELQLALTIKVATTYNGAKLIADNNERTFLGGISDEFQPDSIFNDYGTHGSGYSSSSIWNEYGSFGGKYSSHSPFNSYSSTPPYIVKDGKVIGRLTVSKYVAGAVDPHWLKSHFTY